MVCITQKKITSSKKKKKQTALLNVPSNIVDWDASEHKRNTSLGSGNCWLIRCPLVLPCAGRCTVVLSYLLCDPQRSELREAPRNCSGL